MDYNIFRKIATREFSWKEDLTQTKEDIFLGQYIAEKIAEGLVYIIVSSTAVINLYIGAEAFIRVNSGLLTYQYTPIDRVEDKVYSKWRDERLKGNFLASAAYFLSIPGREIGFRTGKFCRNAIVVDHMGIDGAYDKLAKPFPR